jgi:hypothetical protein
MASRVHGWFGVASLLVVLSGFASWRSVGGTLGRATTKLPSMVPSPELAELMPYSTPVSDTVRVAETSAGAIILRRDPFAPAPAPVRSPRTTAAVRPAAAEHPKWVVTATLTAGTRRAAVINDELVYLGDSVPGGGKLTSVERDRVIVTDAQGAPHTVAVKEDIG